MCENQPLVSVIMPVYNSEKYVSEAIESVCNQSYQDWELVIVDDGSTDKSISIIEAYVKKDSRIRLYKNDSGEHGPGAARNYGIAQIQGKYTYFIDSDDWIERELLQDTVTLAEKTDADIVPFGFVIEDGDKRTKKPLMPSGNFEFEDFRRVANEIVRGTWSECHELIRSELIKDVRHNKYKTGEDICFQMDLLCNVKKVCGIDKEYYHYRVVKDSISHTDKWDDMFMETNIVVWDKERKFLEYCGLNEDSQIMKNAAIERYTWCIYCLCKKECPLSLTQKKNQIRNVANKMSITRYKKGFDCGHYSGVTKIMKRIVRYNMETVAILMGTLCFKVLGKNELSFKED